MGAAGPKDDDVLRPDRDGNGIASAEAIVGPGIDAEAAPLDLYFEAGGRGGAHAPGKDVARLDQLCDPD